MNTTSPALVRGAIIAASLIIFLALLCIRQQFIISRLTGERDALRAQQHVSLPTR